MTRLTKLNKLRVFFEGAPKANIAKMANVLQNYREGVVNNFRTAENAIIALSHPTMFGPRKVVEYYNKAMGVQIERKLVAKLKVDYTLRVLLFTSSARAPTGVVNALNEEQQKTYKKYITKKYPKHRLFWAGRLEVTMGSNEFFEGVKDKLVVGKARNKEWKELTRICLTDPHFKNREQVARGYLEAIMVLSYDKKPEIAGTAPLTTRKRGDDKLMIQYSYASNTIDVAQDTMKEAMENKRYVKNECWLNSIYDFYHDSLLRTDKKKDMVTRETILQVLDRTEDNIKHGLTIDDVLPFFVKYKLRLRVFNIFYKRIFRYDPPVYNGHNKPMYVLADGDHIYTLNHDIKRLEQNQDEDEDNLRCEGFSRVSHKRGQGRSITQDDRPHRRHHQDTQSRAYADGGGTRRRRKGAARHLPGPEGERHGGHPVAALRGQVHAADKLPSGQDRLDVYRGKRAQVHH